MSAVFEGLHEFWNFEKSVFFMIVYIIVQRVKNIFPKFQVNRSKILEERERLSKFSSIRIPMGRLLFWTRFSQNRIFEVGGHDFSKNNAPILLKCCTLLLDKIDSWLNEGYFFLWLQLILQANRWPNFYRNSYCFAYNSAKNSNSHFRQFSYLSFDINLFHSFIYLIFYFIF